MPCDSPRGARFKAEVQTAPRGPSAGAAAHVAELQEHFHRLLRKLKGWELVETAATEASGEGLGVGGL